MSTQAIHAPVVLFALLGIGLPGRGDESPSPRFITSLGTHRLYGGKVTLHLRATKSMIIYEFERDKIRESPSPPRIKKGANWFVFPVSADEFWIYEGGDALTLYTLDDPKYDPNRENHVFIAADKDHNIVKDAPKEVLDRLPNSLKAKYGVR